MMDWSPGWGRYTYTCSVISKLPIQAYIKDSNTRPTRDNAVAINRARSMRPADTSRG